MNLGVDNRPLGVYNNKSRHEVMSRKDTSGDEIILRKSEKGVDKAEKICYNN